MHRRPCSTPPGRGRPRRPWVIYRGIRQRSPNQRDREVIYRESRPGQMRGALRHRPGRRWGPSAGGRMRDFRRVSAQATRSGRRGDRSWPSQSEAGAARTRFPRRPRGGVCHRASARSHNGWRHRASLGASSGVRHRVSLGPSGVAASRERPRRPSAIFHIVTIRSLNRDFAYRICVAC